MGKLVGGRVFVAPNGFDMVRVFRHGFIQPVSDISQETGEVIEEMSALALEKLGKKAKPAEVFEFMGWEEITDPKELEMIAEFEVKP